MEVRIGSTRSDATAVIAMVTFLVVLALAAASAMLVATGNWHW